MRLVAQQKGGFYPAPEKAVAHAASFLRPPKDQPFAILDPCGGEGAAIKQLADLLKCPAQTTYAIELDDSRARTLKTTLPDAHILAPASFFGCRASPGAFSLIWLNPPFDHSYGGHRMEDEFLHKATDWLKPGGVIAFVCPEDVVEEYSDARHHLAIYYHNCKIVPFPEDVRRFKEVIVFGHKRARPVVDEWGLNLWQSAQAPQDFTYHIPSGTGARVFLKA